MLKALNCFKKLHDVGSQRLVASYKFYNTAAILNNLGKLNYFIHQNYNRFHVNNEQLSHMYKKLISMTQNSHESLTSNKLSIDTNYIQHR